MGLANRAIVAGSAGLAVAVLAGCGSNGTLLNSSQANALTGQLNHISQQLRAGNCVQASSEISNFQSAVSSLGSANVNQTLVSNLDQGASTIAQLAQSRCPTGSGAATTPTTTTKTTKAKTTTTSTSTTTTPSTTSTTTTSTTQTGTTSTPSGTTSTPTATSTTGGGGVGTGQGTSATTSGGAGVGG